MQEAGAAGRVAVRDVGGRGDGLHRCQVRGVEGNEHQGVRRRIGSRVDGIGVRLPQVGVVDGEEMQIGDRRGSRLPPRHEQIHHCCSR